MIGSTLLQFCTRQLIRGNTSEGAVSEQSLQTLRKGWSAYGLLRW